MITETVTIVNKLGLHARAASKLVNCASQFESEVFITRKGNRVDAKSIMGVMMLAAEMGSKIIIKAGGPDADDAVEAISELVLNKFNDGESA